LTTRVVGVAVAVDDEGDGMDDDAVDDCATTPAGATAAVVAVPPDPPVLVR
jgi:hypothetical protein